MQDKVDIIDDIDPIESDDIDRFEDDDDVVDEIEEYYQKKERAMNRASMVRGKNSMVPRGKESEDAEDKVSAMKVIANNFNTSSSSRSGNDKHVTKKRRTAQSYFNTIHNQLQKVRDALIQNDESTLDITQRPNTKRAMAARQSQIDKVGNRKVYKNTTVVPPTEQTTDTGHNSILFYELVEKNA